MHIASQQLSNDKIRSFAKISVVVPCYNESRWIERLINAVETSDTLGLEKELIIVDDGSTDGTADVLKSYEGKHTIIYRKSNGGKGIAVRDGFMKATGDLIIIQDADLELNPHEFPRLIEPIINGYADVVYGSRYVGGGSRRVMPIRHRIGNKILTLATNICSGLDITDATICYRLFTREVLTSFNKRLVARGFDIDPELTAHIAKANVRMYEVGVSYYARSYAEGKKLTWKDGLAALWYIGKYNFVCRFLRKQ